MPQLPYAKRISPEAIANTAAKMAAAYNEGSSIRAEATGRSYGYVHRLLGDRDDVTFRSRGGATRKRTT
ncbi:transcriptional regulator [Streptomyces jumonjinensis]|uniref:Transcriptional regulator n=1 Tax=Streptomyces jumonjinensis TaxID=1945 RepID=A0A646KR12_STRJU|nr:transcriptional regulator [Streptomyces jumonjinensis]